MVWGNTFSIHLDPIEKMINMALRLISGSNERAHSSCVRKPGNNYSKNCMCTASSFLCTNFTISFYFAYPFITSFINSDVHDYNTRQRGCLHDTHNKSHSIRYVGVNISNHFMSLLEMDSCYHSYKKNLRYLNFWCSSFVILTISILNKKGLCYYPTACPPWGRCRQSVWRPSASLVMVWE